LSRPSYVKPNIFAPFQQQQNDFQQQQQNNTQQQSNQPMNEKNQFYLLGIEKTQTQTESPSLLLNNNNNINNNISNGVRQSTHTQGQNTQTQMNSPPLLAPIATRPMKKKVCFV
jgi:hypothetical protein